jgi:hypothetical protein
MLPFSCGRAPQAEPDPQIFKAPPAQYGVHAWWHWIDGAVTREGITKDLEAMAEQGITEAVVFSLSLYEAWHAVNPVYRRAGAEHPVVFGSEEWYGMLRWALSEAGRLGMKLGVHNCDGWSTTAGPWITPELSMKKITWSALTLPGGTEADLLLPAPEAAMGFYRDVAVIACKTGDRCIRTEDIADLTGRMDAQGRLKWNVPEGNWKVIRFGYTTTGETNHPASDAGRGLECDKMDTVALKLHFEQFPAKVVRVAGEFPGTLDYLFVDSWECAFQTWTGGFEDVFRQQRGYSMIPYLAVLCGDTVESRQATEGFLHDYRQTLAALVGERYYAFYRRLCDRHRVRFMAEAIYGGEAYPPLDVLKSNTCSVHPMTEFWAQSRRETQIVYHPSDASSRSLPFHSGAVYGNRLLSAEAFTGFARYLETPWMLKSIGDRALCGGINQLVLHSYVHQPDERKPGLTLGEYGLAFNRHVPWFRDAHAWTAYLRRCQYVLQESDPFAEVLQWLGDGAYQQAPATEMDQTATGIPYHLCNTDILLHHARVCNGRILLDNGQSYKLLILPDDDRIAPESLLCIERLVREGATVYGRKPSQPRSLPNGEQSAARIREAADRIWGDALSGIHSCGKGKAITGLSLSQALEAAGVKPDFKQTAGTGTAGLLYFHKTTATKQLFFVVNQEDREADAECDFRVAGAGVQIWDPETGDVRTAGIHAEEEGYTKVPLHLGRRQALFVVFSGRPEPHVTKAVRDGKPCFPQTDGAGGHLPDVVRKDGRLTVTADEAGTYELTADNGDVFTVRTAGRQSLPLAEVAITVRMDTLSVDLPADRLEWLSRHADPRVRYFSGTARYTVTFKLPEENRLPCSLDIGDFSATCAVTLNGYSLGTLVFPGRRLAVDPRLLQAENVLTLDVSSNWRNRLTGAALSGDAGDLYTTAAGTLPDGDTPPENTGINGQIRLLISPPAERDR